ncbi:hypothetical protein D3C80_1981890 [compost metagenome]
MMFTIFEAGASASAFLPLEGFFALSCFFFCSINLSRLSWIGSLTIAGDHRAVFCLISFWTRGMSSLSASASISSK